MCAVYAFEFNLVNQGQIKPNPDWRAVVSPNNRTNEFNCFSYLLFMANKTNSFVC